MEKRLYFYSPGDNFYIAPLTLFVVAKHSVRENGIHWLEPIWKAGPSGEDNGLSLFTSKLDAYIYAITLNEYDKGGWAAYSFSDISVTEMMIDVATIQDKYSIHINFGFAVDNEGKVLCPNEALITKGFVMSFPHEKGSSALNPITLKFSKELFKEINEYWVLHYRDYCKDLNTQNEISNSDMHSFASIAISKMVITTENGLSDFDRVSRFSINKNEWIISI